MFPSYIEQLVGYTLRVSMWYMGTHYIVPEYTQVCMTCMHYCHQTVLHAFNRTCSTVVLA